MSAPTVACVMLANGRPEMVKRAVKSFRAQTYERKRLLICETSGDFIEELSLLDQKSGGQVLYACASQLKGSSIGKLRNAANTSAREISDIICHWDSDDWSHANRIAEQVALLQSSGAECVGYHEMLFWADAAQVHFVGYTPTGVSCACGNRYPRTYGQCNVCNLPPPDAEAWLYRANGNKHLKNYVLGTSMCYWRSTWERFPFPDYTPGCDDLRWANGDKHKGLSAVSIAGESSYYGFEDPRMIASIHGGNACARIDSTSSGGKEVWTRAPEWDTYCREAMKL